MVYPQIGAQESPPLQVQMSHGHFDIALCKLPHVPPYQSLCLESMLTQNFPPLLANMPPGLPNNSVCMQSLISYAAIHDTLLAPCVHKMYCICMLEVSMAQVKLSGAISLWDPEIGHLMGQWISSSPEAQAHWAKAMAVGQLPTIAKCKCKCKLSRGGGGVPTPFCPPTLLAC